MYRDDEPEFDVEPPLYRTLRTLALVLCTAVIIAMLCGQFS